MWVSLAKAIKTQACPFCLVVSSISEGFSEFLNIAQFFQIIFYLIVEGFGVLPHKCSNPEPYFSMPIFH